MQFGKYELGERIAKGGMAEVFAARHFGAEGFVKSVAIKRILPHYCEDPEFVRLFINEATLAAELRHANIVQIHDFDHVEGSYYIAMELVQGRDLRRVLRAADEAGRRLPVEVGVHVVAECLKGLAAAHELCDEADAPLGIVHRDVSPHNMLLSYAGEVKLTDFGIAKAATRSHDTESDVIRGKLPYMSPEQVQGLELDQRSDLFSLGITLWEVATGERLYGQSGSDGLVMEVAEARVSDPAERNASVSPGLREVILRLLEREPDRRYSTAREALATLRERGGAVDRSLELASFMEDLFPQEAAAARRSSTTLTEEVGELAAVWERAQAGASPPSVRAEPSRSRRWPTVALALAVVMAAAGVATLVVELMARDSRLPGVQAGTHPAAALRRTPAAPRARIAPGRVTHAGASLDVTSVPPGAEILVDGVDTQRRTPSRLGVRPGHHRVRVRWGPGLAAEQTRDLVAGVTTRMRFQRPEQPPGRRRAATAPERRRAVAPPERRRAVAAPERRRAAAPPHGPTVASGTARSMSSAGRPAGRSSRVRFTCKPWALVTFGGRSLGQTPRSRTLAPGRYRVTFRNPALGLTRQRTFRVLGDGRDLRVGCRF